MNVTPTNIRIGQGFDVHAFGDGDHIMLGGVRMPHERGVLAHSDGDVVIHALCDAMLGALALGDIGKHFPPSDPQWEGADSRAFLRHCNALIRERGWMLGNADVTVICERPKVGPHAEAMRKEIAPLTKSDAPIVIGPWVGEVGYELLYWIPFLNWALKEFGLTGRRLIVVSRGGARH